MKWRLALLFGIGSLLVVVIAQSPPTINLDKGKNNFSVDSFFYPIYVSTLVSKHPEIESVTLLDYGRSFGYVNVFGGIGTNFIIEQGKTYEIYTSKPMNITLR